MASRHYDHAHPDVVLVALTHPYGWDLLQRFVQRRYGPVVVFTADIEGAIEALEQGADDALCAPYKVREIQARVQARLRAVGQSTAVRGEESLDYIRCGPVLIDLPRYYATLYQVPLDLSPLEFDLLVLFARSPGHTWSRAEIAERVWRIQYVEGDRSIDSVLLRLRRKLGDFGDALETVRGKGYRLCWQSPESVTERTA